MSCAAERKELSELAMCSKNLGTGIARLLELRPLAKLGGVRPAVKLATEGLHALAVASAAGSELGSEQGFEEAWLLGVEATALALAASFAELLDRQAEDVEGSAKLAQALASSVAGAAAGEGTYMSAARFPPCYGQQLQRAERGQGCRWLGPLAASLHTQAARKLVNGAVELAELAGALSRAEAEVAREKAAERAHEAKLRARAAAARAADAAAERAAAAAAASAATSPARPLSASEVQIFVKVSSRV
jgi:hypothetical protein